MILFTGAIGLVTVWAVSVPGYYFMPFVFSLVAWSTLALAGLVRFSLALIDARSRADIRRRWVRWAVMPTIAAITVAMVLTGAPLLLRFGLSRGQMETYARSVVDAASFDAARDPKQIKDSPSRLGFFPVERAEAFPGGMRFIVRGAGFSDDAGFAYSPNGPPPVIAEDFYEPLNGPWYLWRESF